MCESKYAWREIDRIEPPDRPVTDRVHDFQEITVPYDEATARAQASRCIQCPDPVCVQACPLDCPIPSLLGLVADGHFKEAAEQYFATHNIPEITSHVCVGGRVCEQACILAAKTYSVPIRALSRFLFDYGWKHGVAEPPLEPLNGRTVAVLGSGIGGLVAADALSRKGYKVTVFDSREKPGGRMMNGLPGFRMDKVLVERRIGLLKERGIEFRMGLVFGRDVKLSDLRSEFDAVYIAFGTADPISLDIPGSTLHGVYQAFPFVLQNAGVMGDAGIGQATLQITGAAAETPESVRGKLVLVLGCGDTAIDVLRTSIRLGATEAMCVYRRDSDCMQTDTEEFANAQNEGARFMFLTLPVAVLGNTSGEVTGLRCIRMEKTEPDGTGRVGVRPMAGAREFDIPADVIFVAYGYTAPRPPNSDDFAKLVINERGYLQVDEHQMTSFPGVFAGGSIARGPVHLVEVVKDARKAADAIDQYLAALKS